MTSRWQELYSQKKQTSHHDECIHEELRNIEDEIHLRLNAGARENEDLTYYLEGISSHISLGQQCSYDKKSTIDNESDLHIIDFEEEIQADLLLKELDDILEEKEPQTIVKDFGIDQISILYGGSQINNTSPTTLTLIDSEVIPRELHKGKTNDIKISNTLLEYEGTDVLRNDKAFKHLKMKILKTCLQTWQRVTMHHASIIESKKKQFLHRRESLLLKKTYLSWWIMARNYHAWISNSLRQLERKTLEAVFCAWANAIWKEIDETKVRS